MKRNEELLLFLVGEYSLFNAKITRLDIHNEVDVLDIDVYIKIVYSKGEKSLKLIFNGVSEFSIFYTSDYYFYNIESYKLFKSKKGFYVSFDPFDTSNEISPDDQDYILCKNIEGVFYDDDNIE